MPLAALHLCIFLGGDMVFSYICAKYRIWQRCHQSGSEPDLYFRVREDDRYMKAWRSRVGGQKESELAALHSTSDQGAEKRVSVRRGRMFRAISAPF